VHRRLPADGRAVERRRIAPLRRPPRRLRDGRRRRRADPRTRGACAGPRRDRVRAHRRLRRLQRRLRHGPARRARRRRADRDAALADAGASPGEVGFISAHGTGTPINDRVETVAVRTLFGSDAPPISSTKSAIGHLLGAAGSTEALVCIEALRRKLLPPTINYSEPDPECDLDYLVDGAREAPDVSLALSNSFGFGGQNACLAIAAA
jgi:3-oxoacyl-(acyl-carrier-protein) synthase